ncbi:chromosome segregation protein SMC [Leuconostoc falkenbergense]|uniref:chromosome segregation protein SMC n=1 Tax=Leuconostoc falkenbergense TaxID=2766470 RepID=UPI003F9941D6
MKLKSLEISGFKSFADKTMIEFMPGMTGIVGPNGSGKSNIIEAIRWVMGEQSAKDLRGTKMSDVIFGGTNKRGALNRAEVAITFDNSDHYINSDFNEIRVARKLYRTGESVYQINGVESRLRDIHDLFMDTGLGRESFSIISQGRVESIFNAKPEDRRGIIEEVAGVYKYKQNKEKAQKELSQTSDNLSRVADIIHEIEDRIEPLAEQSAQATDYLSQKERFDTLDKARLALTIHDVEMQAEQVKAKFTDQHKQVTTEKSTLSHINEALSQKRQERVSQQLKRDQLQADILALTQTHERMVGAQNLSQQQTATLERDIDEATRSTAEVNEKISALTSQIAPLQQQESELKQQKSTLKKQLTQFDDLTQSELKSKLQADIEKNRHVYIQTMQDIAALHNAKVNDDKQLAQITSRYQTLSERLKNETEIMSQAQQELANYQPNVSAQRDVSALKTAVDKRQEQFDHAARAYKQSETNWYNTLNDLNKIRSQHDALAAMDDYAGFYQGVRALMKPQVRNQFVGIKGVVAELLTVPADYTLAIETVLGGILQQIVVDNTSTAKAVIAYLTKNRAGRVTILPIDTIKPRHLNGLEQARRMAGFVGIAADLVTMPEEMTAIKANILGHIVVAKDLSSATEIAKANQYRFRIVTLDGQLVNAGGSMTGGATQKRGTTILSRQTEIATLTQKITDLTELSKSQELELQSQRHDGEVIRESLIQAQTKLKSANDETQKVDYELQRKQDTLQQQKRVVQALEFELKDILTQQEELTTQLESCESQLNDKQAQKSAQELESQELSRALESASNKAQSHNDDKVAIQTEYVTLTGKLETVTSQLAILRQQQKELEFQAAGLTVKRNDLQAKLTATQNDIATQQQVSDIVEKLTSVQKEHDNISQYLTTISDDLSVLETQFAAQQETLRSVMALESDLAAQQARLTTQNENLLAQLASQYDISDSQDLYQKLTDLNLETVTDQLKLIKRSLDEIGNVNIGAIEEYEAVKQRFDFLTQQRDDLLSAKDNLLQTIDEMDEEVQIRFKHTFDAVAEHFGRIFTQMFGGGRAEIKLTDPDHLLTTGIDITAQPPGKKFQQMSLLSGGEKALTAITLLFAILQVRPVPFVVLDEAEAALDEANVARFARYLHEFSGETQFIVITHRKGTMMNANLLYGVTMQEAGVSKMVAVDLDNMAETAS